MALHEGSHHEHKSVAEHGLCFGSTLLLLIAAVFGLQWVMGLLP